MTDEESPNRVAIRGRQLTALRTLLRTVAASNPFYRPLLLKAGLDGDLPDLDAFFRNMPFTRKEALVADQRAAPPYGTNLTYELSRYTRFTQTSATRGQALRWLDTADSWQWMLDNWKTIFRMAGVAPGDCLYFAFSFGPFLGFWTAFEAACQMGCRSLPSGGLSSLARLNAIRDNGADVLLCTPTYALRLAEVATAEKIDLAEMPIRTLIVAGEPGGSAPAVRTKIERAWPKAKVFDHHGMTEVGPVSYQCPERPGTLVVIESSYVAEILDPNGTVPVAPGDIGELVLTTLGRPGSPMIRYRTGDLVREDREVPETLGIHELALVGGILGCADDMLLIRGVNVYPGALDEMLHSIPEVAQYQVEIDETASMTELYLRIEAISGVDEDLAVRVESRLCAAFNLRVPVTVHPAGTLPRSEMKSNRWIRRQ